MMGRTLVFLGFSFSDQDDHLLDAICRGKRAEQIAISIDATDPDGGYRARAHVKLEARLRPDHLEIVFYDRDSANCWIHYN
jgi:Domain of unknown function (DUF4917)